MNIETLRTGLLKWANTVLNPGVLVIPSDSTQPSPKTTWISMKLTAFAQVGEDVVGAPNGTTGDATITGNREWIGSFRATGTGSLQALSDLRDSLQKETIRDGLLADGIIYVTPEGGVQNLTGLIEQTSVEEGNLDIRFRTDSNITDSLGVIEHAQLQGTFKRTPSDAHPLVKNFSI